ncbi:M56 family metallopeptidase [Lachnospiraceae bacterium ZAX-1]
MSCWKQAATSVFPGSSSHFASFLLFIWLTGIVALGSYFAVAYFKHRREFEASLPIDTDLVLAWQKAHKLKRPYSIRMSDQTTVPLTYGVFRPVILLPKKTDFSDEKKRSYILTHEFIHIRRFDALTKIIATTALCVHWFNPFVWAMYILLNRDIEISCDETVVREFGETSNSMYALMLIGIEEKKSVFSMLYSGFSRYAIEERVNAIMKMKKGSTISGIIVAATLVVGTIAVFATSALERTSETPNKITSLSTMSVNEIAKALPGVESSAEIPDNSSNRGLSNGRVKLRDR